MNSHRFLLFFYLLTSLFTVNLYAKNYYVSNNGDDDASGKSPSSSFQSITRLNDIRFKPGDTIFLNAGDYFTGTLKLTRSGSRENPIVITSYGSGAKPVLSGSTILGRFEKVNDHVLATKSTNPIHHLYKNGKICIIARYPDAGYLKMDGGGKDFLNDFDFPLTHQQVKGATARMRINNWQYEYRGITKLEDHTLWFDSILWNRPDKQNTCKKGWGYYLDNSKAFLDNEGEWYFSPAENKVYIYTKKSITPDDKFEASHIKNGIVLAEDVSNIIFNNLCISGQSDNGIIGKGNNKNIRVVNCKLSKIGKYGIYMKQCHHVEVKNCEIGHILGNGIKFLEAYQSKIKDNSIEQIGIIPGYGIDGVNGAIGISIVNEEKSYKDIKKLSHANFIQNNYIDSTGYSAIRMDGHHSLCENNILKNGMLTLNDGGLFYCWGFDSTYTFNNIVRGNIIINAVGNVDESTLNHHKINQGIYLDARCKDFTIENNIITNTGAAILLNTETYRNTVKNNLCYNNKTGMSISAHENFGNHVSKNTFIVLKSLTHTLSIANHKDTIINPGILNHNVYVSPAEKFHIKLLHVEDERKLIQEVTLNGWQNISGQDQQSVFFNPDKLEPNYPLSKIFINESNATKTYNLDEHFEYIDIKGNKINKILVLDAKKAQVVFYQKKKTEK